MIESTTKPLSAAQSERIETLMAQMTLEEKLGQLTQPHNSDEISLEDLAAGRIGSVIGAFGPFAGNDPQKKVSAEKMNDLQRVAIEKSRLGIPIVVARDVIHGHRTVWPIGLGSACAWSPRLVEECATIAAREACADSIRWVFSPMLDIARDPRWGRVAEGFGEDPYLCSQLGAAVVRGFQGGDMSEPGRVAACAKHFAGYGGSEGGRDYNASEISLNTLRNIYLPSFHAAVRSGVASIMPSLSEVNGYSGAASKWLLKEVLRGEWGYDGVIVSDWGAVDELLYHAVATTKGDATRIALETGIDIEMTTRCFLETADEEIKSGRLDPKLIDDAVRRVLALKTRLGLFERPYVDLEVVANAQFLPESQATVLELSRRSLVLLENERGEDGARALPLDTALGRLVVYGPLATCRRELWGTWTLDALEEETTSILAALKDRVKADELLYTPHADDAVNFARYADAVIAVVGETPNRSGEDNSVVDLGLPPGQLEVLKALRVTAKRLIVVVLSGRPLDLSWLGEHADALLLAWHPGSMGGIAIAETLTGANNPSGKLSITLPRCLGQIPIYYNRRATGRPDYTELFGKTRYVDAWETPLYPFGFGLSYSQFAYSDFELEKGSDGVWTASATIANTSDRQAEEVAQLYVRDEVARIARPYKELKGFARISLAAGEATRVSFRLDDQALGYFGPEGTWAVEPGWFTVWIGPDSTSGSMARMEVN